MSYQHIRFAGGQKITVNADFSLNVPEQPIVPSSKAMALAPTSRR